MILVKSWASPASPFQPPGEEIYAALYGVEVGCVKATRGSCQVGAVKLIGQFLQGKI